ncbi:FadR/GntR family transcriptional regulator [Caulobacter hibisci]|uniref:FadR family transcriptional regulator n=1 Tax=Caulobacter hibisci TaxID=2035993 RepID=A0ABS0SZ97_9CAUL|nr:FadR/GntR family transcriptional regulator [Caulobacter hibisci]MBI1684955.1 FadR family transcriptional regulator [Caulobacter hibisci]
MSAKAEGRLYERVARDLASQIAEGRYAVGQRLPSERDLAQTYSVSRPTVREAIIALELDGLVEVRLGSGVYVKAQVPEQGQAGVTDIGPFELLEARRAIEAEACAMAAKRISDEALVELEGLVAEMQAENARDVDRAEDADRRFHMLIVESTQNSAMIAAVEMLWEARARSPQTQLMGVKAHAAGVIPRIDEHTAIVSALRARSPEEARDAMRRHLTRVLNSLLAATEVQELEEARARIAATRDRYTDAD